MHDGGEHRELGCADGVGLILDDWNKGGADHDRMDGTVGMPERKRLTRPCSHRSARRDDNEHHVAAVARVDRGDVGPPGPTLVGIDRELDFDDDGAARRTRWRVGQEEDEIGGAFRRARLRERRIAELDVVERR